MFTQSAKLVLAANNGEYALFEQNEGGLKEADVPLRVQKIYAQVADSALAFRDETWKAIWPDDDIFECHVALLCPLEAVSQLADEKFLQQLSDRQLCLLVSYHDRRQMFTPMVACVGLLGIKLSKAELQQAKLHESSNISAFSPAVGSYFPYRFVASAASPCLNVSTANWEQLQGRNLPPWLLTNNAVDFPDYIPMWLLGGPETKEQQDDIDYLQFPPLNVMNYPEDNYAQFKREVQIYVCCPDKDHVSDPSANQGSGT